MDLIKKMAAAASVLIISALVIIPACKKEPPSKKCDPKPIPNCYNTKELNPVCGCDGKTYQNPSQAACNNITDYTPGPCKKDPPKDSCKEQLRNSTCICPQVIDPVCGCNGKTYNNSCEAACVGITQYTKGPCKGGNNGDCKRQVKDPNCICPKNYDPVCGCDDVTYGNSCEADCAGVLKYTKGPCKQQDPPKDTCVKQKIECFAPCQDVDEPVCGCDGVTYKNSCVASCENGIQKYTPGPCKGSNTR